MFLDCFGREIEVGHVLANGQRQSTHGGITIGVVTGFTQACILVDMLEVKCIYTPPAEIAALDYWKRPYKREWEVPQGYYFRKSRFNAPQNCYVTGLTREALIESVTQPLGIGEMEDPKVTWNREHKAKMEKYAVKQAQQEAGLAEITQISQKYGLYD